MSKKRTRAQKIKAQSKSQQIFKNLPKSFKYKHLASNVKSQFENTKNLKKAESSLNNSSVSTDNNGNLKLIKKELVKSLIVSSLILCLIAMIYLLWNKV